MYENPKISIAVPTHEMANGEFFLTRLLDSLWNQSYQDFEIVVTDNSDNEVVRDICMHYKTGIHYIKNPRKGMAQNTNEAIKFSKGKLIKILYMDDYLLHDKFLEELNFKFTNGWLVAGTDNNLMPHWTEDIEKGNNKLGSPSSLTIENKEPFLFDEALTWLLDCDYYKRLHERYGEPTILPGKHIGIGIHEGQMTNITPPERKQLEYEYLNQKYG